jgi:predicted lactoylglutathione lyase
MTDQATPNLPSRDFEATARFYAALGFQEGWQKGHSLRFFAKLIGAWVTMGFRSPGITCVMGALNASK